MPQLSVLIPVYNAQKYLRECLDSVCSQTLSDIEIICINDGSEDNSKRIIEEYIAQDKRIKLIDKENSGYGQSLNIALKEANSQYIAIVESDDFISKDMFQVLFDEKEDCEIVKGSFYFYPENNAYTLPEGTLNTKKAPYILNIKPTIWSAIYKRDFILDNEIFFREDKKSSYQDTSFQFRAFYLARNIKFINKPLYFYRTDNQSSSVNSKDKIFDILREFEIIDKFLEDKNIEDLILSQKILFELHAYLWNYRRTRDFEFLKKASQKINTLNYNIFIKDKKIKLKDKIKFTLLKILGNVL